MTTLTDSEIQDLTYTLDDAEIRNDLRVMVPNYRYVITWVGMAATVTYYNLVLTSLSSSSIDKYGRRTKVNKFQVINDEFVEAWCENSKQEYAEPYAEAEVVLPGVDSNIVKCLSTKISDVFTLTNSTSGIDDKYKVSGYVLDVRPGYLKTTLKLNGLTALQQLSLFIVDTDLIDGDHVIG
jgi:hypothetical protein